MNSYEWTVLILEKMPVWALVILVILLGVLVFFMINKLFTNKKGVKKVE